MDEELTSSEWKALETSAAVRREAHCPICMESFSSGHEVLLSCSHIFHRACLSAFEKFVRSAERRCPICRSANYEKKITHEGSKAYQRVSAIRIQALWRGFKARGAFKVARKEFYQQGKGGAGERRRYFAEQWRSINSQLSARAVEEDEIADVLCFSDSTLSAARELDDEFARMLAERAARPTLVAESQQWPQLAEEEVISEEAWEGKLALSLSRRHQRECAICMVAIHSSALPHHRRSVLLSCSHRFHDKCISRFELLLSANASAADAAGESEGARCPVCRSAYQKRLLALDHEHFI